MNRNPGAVALRLRNRLAAKRGASTWCLTMIVKNEAANMRRVLDSLLGVVDYISVCDTGSTDDTASVIEAWGKWNRVPTQVHHEPFRNFAYNRTVAVQLAQQSFPQADYLLLSDADFVWQKQSNFTKEGLADDLYLVQQENQVLSYWNIRLLSTKVPWEFKGNTHEFATTTDAYHKQVKQGKYTGLIIDDKEDGGCKTDKFERDERLLRQGLDDPTTPKKLKTRYRFYLSQTLKDTKRYTEAIEWYQKRIDDGGWAEEVYHSLYQIGFCEESLAWTTSSPEREAHFQRAEASYRRASRFRPCRGEALYHCTRMLRMRGRYQESYTLACQGEKLEYPTYDTLFLERNCYRYLFTMERGLAASQLPSHQKEVKEIKRALRRRDDLLPEHRKLLDQEWQK